MSEATPPREHQELTQLTGELPTSIREVTVEGYKNWGERIRSGQGLNAFQHGAVFDYVRCGIAQKATLERHCVAFTLWELRQRKAANTLAESDVTLLEKLERAAEKQKELHTLVASLDQPREHAPGKRAPPTVHVSIQHFIGKIRQAITYQNYEGAADAADDALTVYPRNPDILFCAAAAHAKRAVKVGTVLERRIHMRRAIELFDACTAACGQEEANAKVLTTAREQRVRALELQAQLEKVKMEPDSPTPS